MDEWFWFCFKRDKKGEEKKNGEHFLVKEKQQKQKN